MNSEPPVLLVEDNIDDVVLIERAFDKARIANPLRSVGDGDEAVAYLAGQGAYSDRHAHPLPVLLLLDLKLPRRGGLEVLAWLRREPSLRRLPVVVLTSSREGADVNRAYELGVNSYLVKPVAFDALLDMMETLNLYWLLLNERPTMVET
jgi:CheY-like chemotaxis protein